MDLQLDNSTQFFKILEISSFKVASSMSVKLVDSFLNLNIKGHQYLVDFEFLQITVKVSPKYVVI